MTVRPLPDNPLRPEMREPCFDIFSGAPDKTPVWIETVYGLSNARERMAAIAARKPGAYFVFSIVSQAKPQSVPKSKSNAA